MHYPTRVRSKRIAMYGAGRGPTPTSVAAGQRSDSGSRVDDQRLDERLGRRVVLPELLEHVRERRLLELVGLAFLFASAAAITVSMVTPDVV